MCVVLAATKLVQILLTREICIVPRIFSKPFVYPFVVTTHESYLSIIKTAKQRSKWHSIQIKAKNNLVCDLLFFNKIEK